MSTTGVSGDAFTRAAVIRSMSASSKAPSSAPLGHEPAVLGTIGLDDRHYAMAEQYVRRLANSHGCVNRHDRDGSCTDPAHRGDAEKALEVLFALRLRPDPGASWKPGPGYLHGAKRRRAAPG